MTAQDEIEIKKIILNFLTEMNEWEKQCNIIANNSDLTFEEKFLKKKEILKKIFNEVCTKKDRKNGKPNTIAYGDEEHFHYDLSKESITEIVEDEKNSRKILVHTFRDDPMDEKFIYVVVKKKDKWLLDSKKRFSAWKDKWENVSL